MKVAWTFLSRYDKGGGNEFKYEIVTGDETWISHVTPQTKRQSVDGMAPFAFPKKAKRILSSNKFMATVFWDRKGVLLVDYMPRGETINAEANCQTVHRLRHAIQNKLERINSIWLNN